MEENQWNTNEHPYQQPPVYFQRSAPNGMATASLVMGILSLVMICCGFSFVFGSLGILFALLSRTRNSMESTAKIGLGLSIAGTIIGTLATISVFVTNFEQFEQNMDSYEEFYFQEEDSSPYQEDFFDQFDGYEIYEEPIEDFTEQLT